MNNYTYDYDYQTVVEENIHAVAVIVTDLGKRNVNQGGTGGTPIKI